MPQSASERCPVCGSVGEGRYVDKSFDHIQSTWFRCRADGTLFMSPLPAPRELEDYYRSNYANRKCPGAVSHRFRFSEENKGTIFREYELSLSDVGISGEMLRNQRILDYGCANGMFLDYCFGKGCRKEDLYGYDIAEDLLKVVGEKGYRLLGEERDFFDFIFLWDVLEHIPDPRALLQRLRSYLQLAGNVVVQTPRVGILSESLRENWEHFLPLEHVILYTREALIALFDEFGFHVRKAGSFGGNAPPNLIPNPYKNAYDSLAKRTDNGSTQIAHFALGNAG